MMNYISQYPGIFVIVIFAIIYLLLYPLEAKKIAKGIAKDYIFKAQKRAKELILTSGPEKHQWVVEQAYNVLPSVVKLLISPKVFSSLVQEAYDELVDYVDDGKLNNSNEANNS